MRNKVKKGIKNFSGRNFNKKRVSDKQSILSRSSQMSKIRSQNTRLENQFISLLREKTKEKFKTHDRKIKGTPDVVFHHQKLCVFLDSDFWHGWQYPRWKHLMKNDFWRNKINNNRKRDKKITLFLKKCGWTVLRIWEHHIKNEATVNHEIQKLKLCLAKKNQK